MDRVSEFKSQTDIDTTGVTQNYQNRTSFLIEDILYREKSDELQNEQETRQVQNSSFNKPSQQIKYNDNNDGKLYLQHHVQQQQQQQQQHQSQQQYANKSLEKRHENLKGYGYFQPSIIQQSGGVSGASVGNIGGQQSFQSPDNGYIQVMGALGAYLNTPYKSIADPYFLTQGKHKPPKKCSSTS